MGDGGRGEGWSANEKQLLAELEDALGAERLLA